MKHLKIIHLTINILFICVFANAQTTISNAARFESIIEEAFSKNVFSGNVLIVKNGDIFFQKSIGNSDYIKNIPNNPDTEFQTGSVTKFFVKTLIYQLAEEGKISLSDNMGKYLTGFAPEVSDVVTIQQLVNHSSGFGDFFRESLNNVSLQNAVTINDVIAVIQQEKSEFIPGSEVKYSNSGYVILAAIIEKAEGKSLEEVLKEKIFDKTVMNNTGFKVVNIEVDGKAKGYLSNQIGPKQDNSDMNLIGAGAGGIFSTTGDMNKFAQSLINDNVLLKDESKLMLFNSPMSPVKYSSWEEFKTKGRFAIAGGAPGISAVFAINNEKDYVAVVLSNYDEGTAEEVSQRLFAALNDKEVRPFSPPPAQVIYNIIKEKGPDNFITNYKNELSSAGIKLEDDMVLLFAGQELLRESDADNAIALYTVYTTEFPEIVIAWNDMGDAYLLKGDKEKAKKCYEQALVLRPANVRAKESLEKLK